MVKKIPGSNGASARKDTRANSASCASPVTTTRTTAAPSPGASRAAATITRTSATLRRASASASTTRRGTTASGAPRDSTATLSWGRRTTAHPAPVPTAGRASRFRATRTAPYVQSVPQEEQVRRVQGLQQPQISSIARCLYINTNSIKTP